MNLNRRNFLKSGGLMMAGLGSGIYPVFSKEQEKELTKMKQTVKFTRDGLDLTPLETISLLHDLEQRGEIRIDNYSLGGSVADLEKKFSELLGKEAAIFMPTGTLANHIAIRKLASDKKRVIVQAESHIYRDTGDCAQNLSNLNLIPLRSGETDFTVEDVKEVFMRTREGRVHSDIGAISLESPVRRKHNQMFQFSEMQKIADFAREEKIGIHLDGARLFNASVHSNIPPDQFAAMFDTVYVSLYKNFSAPSGAILTGRKAFIEGLYHTRRMFGGGLVQVWPYAATALHYADSFLTDYKESVSVAETFFKMIEESSKLEVKRIPDGTNVFILKVVDANPERFRQKLEDQNILIPPPVSGTDEFEMKINPTITRISTDLLAERFLDAAG